jgi:hypothetical protein
VAEYIKSPETLTVLEAFVLVMAGTTPAEILPTTLINPVELLTMGERVLVVAVTLPVTVTVPVELLKMT